MELHQEEVNTHLTVLWIYGQRGISLIGTVEGGVMLRAIMDRQICRVLIILHLHLGTLLTNQGIKKVEK
jgi:hypothetical protein